MSVYYLFLEMRKMY